MSANVGKPLHILTAMNSKPLIDSIRDIPITTGMKVVSLDIINLCINIPIKESLLGQK